MVAEDFVEVNPLPGQGPGRAGRAGVLSMMFAGFPDLEPRQDPSPNKDTRPSRL